MMGNRGLHGSAEGLTHGGGEAAVNVVVKMQYCTHAKIHDHCY